ncbi:MSHA biogenesis protein MshK [Pseudoduganella sp. GCM10020061]|uniref:MSHA biogenesis protein MshK n=1 Tax=Pseudoduganella sp. GCM10020061 TaxID=3317345 RepID=UPI003634CF4C
MACALPAIAQMRDPTAPPVSLRQSASGAHEQLEAPVAPRLQSVLISSKRRVAVIDGQTVRLGQKHRGAVVASITPTQVVLVRGSARETLKLYPASPGAAGQGQR